MPAAAPLCMASVRSAKLEIICANTFLKPICAENPQIICANMLKKYLCAENPCVMTTDKKPAEDNPAAGKPKKESHNLTSIRFG